MRILFSHPNFPGQFRYLIGAINSSDKHDVRFLTNTERPEWEVNGVKKVVYDVEFKNNAQYHPYLGNAQRSVLTAQSAFFRCVQLKSDGFVPDLIISHSGWGQSMFFKDVFPNAYIISYFEWYFEPRGVAFRSLIRDDDVGKSLSMHDALSSKVSNFPILQDLVNCDVGVIPTQWQKNQFPSEFQNKIHVIHEGIDTNFFIPLLDNKYGAHIRREIGVESSCPLVTYTTRAFEPMRGFPSFMRALLLAQLEHDDFHALIVGDDARVCYGDPRSDGISYKQYMLNELGDRADWSRIHFLPPRTYTEYLSILQASDCHVYLTKPYVLSWSFLESLSCAVPVIASSTPPVHEIVGHQDDYCTLVDFWSPENIANSIINILGYPKIYRDKATLAREHIVGNYSATRGLTSWNALIASKIDRSIL